MFTLNSRSKRHGLFKRAAWLLLPLAALLGCGEEERPPEIIRTVKWMEVSETSATQVRKISGVVKAVDETYLSFAVGGTVESVNVDLGDRIKKNGVLAVLDKKPFQLAVQNADGELKKAQAKVLERRANYERTSALYESNNASKAELDEARAGFDNSKGQVKAMKAQLGLARRDLEKTILRAPYNGVISVKQIEPHVEVPPGQAVFGLDGEESGFEVAVAVPETLVFHVAAGQKATVFFPTLKNRKVPGAIREVGTRSQTANAYPVTVRLGEQFSELRSGMSVEVAFEYESTSLSGDVIKTGIKVPVTAIRSGADNTYYVFIYDKQTSSVTKSLVDGVTIQGNDVILTSGLKAGNIIVTAGVEFLNDKQKVKLMQKTD
ncbi:MAG: efflux RND transporter periplasmic adaptor subunit [Desulfobacterales bacterium]|nr:MAG: efflux RND transporter periplasmic adaptor subunit [Desulfobacterales bacterium]